MSSNTDLWEGAQCCKNRYHQEPYYYCMRCDKMVCRDCWFEIGKHRSQEPGHDKTRPNDAIIVHSILKVRLGERPLLENAISRCRAPYLRQIDDNTEWFGVGRKNEAGDYSLVEGHAYNLIVDPPGSFKDRTYPRLVSFVGETGSGKSTLIGLLFKFSNFFPTNHFKTPAVGDPGSLQSTSSNVHLYVDPRTFQTRSPILYAESEGMNGDDIPTEMKKFQVGASASRDPLSRTSQMSELNSQDIIWSKMPKGAWTRKEIIRTLFPRILYIFSDVVVFPFNRIRPGDTILQLVKWGHSAMVQSYNKPALPSAIIVFLNWDDQVDSYEYDLSAAKWSFFTGFRDFSKDKALQPYIQYWKTHQEPIFSVEGLLRCYYYSVSVVQLPSSQHPTIMRLQIEKLHARITELCLQSKNRRHVTSMNWNAATLPLFVRKAFAYFATKCETPFNFSDAWVDLQCPSPNFAWSIFNLARMARGHRDPSRAGMDLWVDISGFVASCVFLNCVREKQDDYRVAEEVQKHCDESIEQYWRKFWPCGYRLLTPEGYRQCVNAPRGHPHHQGSNSVVSGHHKAIPSLIELQREFHDLVVKAFDRLKPRFKRPGDDYKRLLRASETHLKKTRNFYKSIGGIDRRVSHLVCLVCLHGVPEHSLPCGHVICRECAKATGDSTPGRFVTLHECPLQNHRKEDWPRGWSKS